jgi:type II restriction enzyme
VSYKLIEEENEHLRKILEESYYMAPVIKRIDQYGDYSVALENLNQIITSSHPDVLELIEKRKEEGLIKDVSQASKVVVGKIFEYSITYSFFKLKIVGIINPNIFITSKRKSKSAKNLESLMTINVAGEIQKPDADLFFYTSDEKNEINNFVIVSLKTSLRERVGQTYKWKLLMEIASCDNPIKDKYNLNYQQKILPKVCFATINFYDEIKQPQHKGMLQFFDKSFIGKPINEDFISKLSFLPQFLNETLA